MLKNVSTLDLSTCVLGEKISMPICIAATAMQCMAHADGEIASARGMFRVWKFLVKKISREDGSVKGRNVFVQIKEILFSPVCYVYFKMIFCLGNNKLILYPVF